MIDRKWYDEYYERYRKALFEHDMFEICLELKAWTSTVKSNGGKLIFAGNGASATIASHAAGDFTKQAGIPATTFHDPGLLTMMSNDFGYEQCLAQCVDAFCQPDDLVVLISSSGTSKNMLNAGDKAKSKGVKLVTFTGFEEHNPLKSLGDLNFWLPSRAYNIIENTHSIWLTTVIDMHIGSAEYAVS